MGKWHEAQRDYEQAISQLREAGRPWGTAYTLHNLRVLLLAEGQESGKAYLEQAHELAQESLDRLALRMVPGVLAEQDILRGAAQQAYARLELLIEEIVTEQYHPFSLLPWIYMELEEVEAAQHLIDRACVGATAEHLRPVLVDVLAIQARLAAAQERRQIAERALVTALRLCREMPWPYAEAKILYVAGIVARRQRAPAQARDHFRAALTILHGLGERWYAEIIEQASREIEVWPVEQS